MAVPTTLDAKVLALCFVMADDDGSGAESLRLLEKMKLNRLPSPEEIEETITEKWLTPKDTLPDHWLDQYQTLVLAFRESLFEEYAL